jgi:hypothetical protein
MPSEIHCCIILLAAQQRTNSGHSRNVDQNTKEEFYTFWRYQFFDSTNSGDAFSDFFLSKNLSP